MKGEAGEKDLDELLAKCIMNLLGELKPVDLMYLTVVKSIDDMQNDDVKKPEIKEVPPGYNWHSGNIEHAGCIHKGRMVGVTDKISKISFFKACLVIFRCH